MGTTSIDHIPFRQLKMQRLSSYAQSVLAVLAQDQSLEKCIDATDRASEKAHAFELQAQTFVANTSPVPSTLSNPRPDLVQEGSESFNRDTIADGYPMA